MYGKCIKLMFVMFGWSKYFIVVVFRCLKIVEMFKEIDWCYLVI